MWSCSQNSSRLFVRVSEYCSSTQIFSRIIIHIFSIPIAIFQVERVANNFYNDTIITNFLLLLCISPWILLFQWWNIWKSWLKPFVMLCYAWINFDDKAGIRFLEVTVQIFLTPHKCSWEHKGLQIFKVLVNLWSYLLTLLKSNLVPSFFLSRLFSHLVSHPHILLQYQNHTIYTYEQKILQNESSINSNFDINAIKALQILPLIRLMTSWEFLQIVYMQHMHGQSHMQLCYTPIQFLSCLIHLL